MGFVQRTSTLRKIGVVKIVDENGHEGREVSDGMDIHFFFIRKLIRN